jgi:hypothetical protein
VTDHRRADRCNDPPVMSVGEEEGTRAYGACVVLSMWRLAVSDSSYIAK